QPSPISAVDSNVEFRELVLPEPVTSMKMTEDGKYLLFSHQIGNLVSVYDVLKNEVVAQTSCPSPRSLLCRGDFVFVANYGEGTISVLSRSKNWNLVNSLRVSMPRVMHIDARP